MVKDISESDQHPQAPQDRDGASPTNDRATVRMRGAVTTGTMRWVLGIGLLLAVVAMGMVWGLTPTD